MSVTSPDSGSLSVVIDAGIGIQAILPGDFSPFIISLLSRWQQRQVRKVAPSLWLAECLGGVRQQVYAGTISLDEGREAVETIFTLKVDILEPTQILCRSAFEWAARLDQRRAYDAFYVALAEHLKAHLWSTDERLVNRARTLGVDWVQWVGEDLTND